MSIAKVFIRNEKLYKPVAKALIRVEKFYKPIEKLHMPVATLFLATSTFSMTSTSARI